MKSTKKLLSVLLSMVMLILAVSFCFISFAADASGGCGSGLTWKYSDSAKTLTISGSGAMNDYAVSKTYDEWWKEESDLRTTAPWYSHYADITKINIEYGVTKIGKNAFRRCINVMKIDIPDSVETIGQDAFSFCKSMVSAKLGTKVKTIGAYAFNGCTSLTSVNIPDTVESISTQAFFKCPIKDLQLGKNVETIGKNAFSQCKLVNVSMYNKVSAIGENAFAKQNGKANNVISHVYYYGSQAEWNAIAIGQGNEPLTGAAIHYNSTGPATEPVTQPTDPVTQPTQPTTSAQQQDSGKQLNFLERIFQMILDFFARLFGR